MPKITVQLANHKPITLWDRVKRQVMKYRIAKAAYDMSKECDLTYEEIEELIEDLTPLPTDAVFDALDF